MRMKKRRLVRRRASGSLSKPSPCRHSKSIPVSLSPSLHPRHHQIKDSYPGALPLPCTKSVTFHSVSFKPSHHVNVDIRLFVCIPFIIDFHFLLKCFFSISPKVFQIYQSWSKIVRQALPDIHAGILPMNCFHIQKVPNC